MIRYFYISAILVLVTAWPPLFQLNEIFVDPNGTASGDGSSTYPFGTVAQGIAMANPEGGDVIVIGAGNYNENLIINKPVTLRTVNAQSAIIGQGKSSQNNPCNKKGPGVNLELEEISSYFPARSVLVELLEREFQYLPPRMRHVEAQLNTLTVNIPDGGEQENDPYLIVVGFRTKPFVPRSTSVWVTTLEPQYWGINMAVGEQRTIPENVGRVLFTDVCNTPEQFEILGVAIIAMEADHTPWSGPIGTDITGIMNDVVMGLYYGIENSVAVPLRARPNWEEAVIEGLQDYFSDPVQLQKIQEATGKFFDSADYEQYLLDLGPDKLASSIVSKLLVSSIQNYVGEAVGRGLFEAAAAVVGSAGDWDDVIGVQTLVYSSAEVEEDKDSLSIITPGPIEDLFFNIKQEEAGAGGPFSPFGDGAYQVTGVITELNADPPSCPVAEGTAPTTGNNWTTGTWIDRFVFRKLESSHAGIDLANLQTVQQYLRQGLAVAVFFEDNDFSGRYSIVASHNQFGNLRDEIVLSGISEGVPQDDEVDSILFFVPNNNYIQLEVFEDALEDGRNDDSHVRICGPAALSNLNDEFGRFSGEGFGMGGDEMTSFRFVTH